MQSGYFKKSMTLVDLNKNMRIRMVFVVRKCFSACIVKQ